MKFVVLLALVAVPAFAITLVNQGHSDYSIVLSSQASPSEHRAAAELQRYIAEMSGAHLPILDDAHPTPGHLILLGDSSTLRARRISIPVPSLGTEGFVIRTAGQDLVIAGGRERGTLYGVYTF